MLNVVFDTVIFVRSLINPLGKFGKVVFQYSSSYQLFVSKPVVIEIMEVLNCPEVTVLFRTLENLDKERVIDIISQAEVVEIFDVPRVSRDTKDDKFLATAKSAKADYLVSEDRDLLDLKEYEGIKIINVETFLKILEDKVHKRKS